MTPERFEELLYESESETLDFKGAQYAFSDATDEEKSELLKDILGFANAWRRSEAYILIGVREVSGKKAVVVGIEKHLSDHSLQQFVSTKTNRPVRFSYETLLFEGKQVGIIAIQEQTRPFWLSKDYGRLNKEEVYVRRGSSTDPTRPASPDEIVKMTQVSTPRAATLETQFTDTGNGRLLGHSLHMEVQFVQVPSGDELPGLSLPHRQNHHFLMPDLSNLLRETNADYYREAAVFVHRHTNFRPLQLAIRNTGEVSADDVRIELILPTNDGLEVLEDWEMNEEFPKKEYDKLRAVSASVTTGHLQPVHRHDGDVDIVRNSDSVVLEIEYKRIQPGRKVLTNKFYVACRKSGTIKFTGTVFSKNLPQPVDIELSIEFDVSLEQLDRDRFLEWADNPQFAEEE